MKIQSLTLHGFKSFADRTEVEFHEGITAIVGPNGCGKSNISDALRWVLGEQRPTAIRGSRMEEAIFEGTAERRPISRAEVSLTLSNEDGVLPVPYREVVIGRTVYRGGESDYRLNGDACRLRDIQDLCRDTGLGATEYSVIENSLIDVILSDRAEERRTLFEEAAEIGRYKDRRRTALRRLDQARDDLERLEDVIGEIRTKVRSLAQQRSRAERRREYRDRLLRLEVAVADVRLEDLDGGVEEAESELEELRADGPERESELSERETRAETLRVEIAEAEKERSERAGRLEELRTRLERKERERIVASERTTAARRRIEAIETELSSMQERRGELEEEVSRLEEHTREERSRVSELESRREGWEAEAAELEDTRARREEREEELAGDLSEVERRIRRLEARGEGRAERLRERRSELERRREALEERRAAVAGIERSLARAEEEADESGSHSSEIESSLEAAREEARRCREATRELRDRAGALEGELSGDRARAGSLADLLESGGDLPGVVSRLLTEDDELPGLHGVLADHVRVPARDAAAVEAHASDYLHGLVVDDWETVRRIRAWLVEREEEEGMLLLPLDPGPRSPEREIDTGSGGSLLDRVEPHGAGAPWVRALLRGVAVREEEAFSPRADSWVGVDGSGQDRRGAVRLGQPSAARGALRRRAELSELRERVESREEDLRRLRRELADSEEELAAAESRVESLEERLDEATREARRAEAERERLTERRSRAGDEVAELEDGIRELEASVADARAEAEEDEERLAGLRREQDELGEELSEVRSLAEEARDRWEERRGQLHDLQLQLARREGDLSSAEESLARSRTALDELAEREERLREERERERTALSESGETIRRSEEEVGELLEIRGELEEELKESREKIERGKEELEAQERWLREARRSEREQSERRHSLELRLAEMRGQRSSILERIEGEWEEPLDALRERVEPPEEGSLDAWSAELEEVRRRLSRLGPVNLLAAEEYEEEKERLDFLLDQREDLTEARDDLHDSIRRINRAAASSFRETFAEIRENFQRTFETLFEGGECDLWLEDDEEPLDSPIEISASPRGKRTQRIHLLSGGERALTALALLFAIYLAKPSPFCIMDEVDAALDPSNVQRFVQMLERFASETQFIVITHNPLTIEAAEWVYGVTMQEPGVSSIVGVEFGDPPAEEDVA